MSSFDVDEGSFWPRVHDHPTLIRDRNLTADKVASKVKSLLLDTKDVLASAFTSPNYAFVA